MFLELSIGRFDCKITTDSNIRKWGQFTENPPSIPSTDLLSILYLYQALNFASNNLIT